MNRDGKLDIVLDGYSLIPNTLNQIYSMSILWNKGGTPPVFTEECLTSSTTISRPVYDVGDINKDGNLDILTLHFDRETQGLDWLENDGTRSPKFIRHHLTDLYTGAKLCDLDGDGDLDLVSQYAVDYLENKGGKPPIFQYHALASFDKTRTFIQGAIVHLFDKNHWQFVVGHYNPISYYHESEIDIFDTTVTPASGVSGKHWAFYH